MNTEDRFLPFVKDGNIWREIRGLNTMVGCSEEEAEQLTLYYKRKGYKTEIRPFSECIKLKK